MKKAGMLFMTQLTLYLSLASSTLVFRESCPINCECESLDTATITIKCQKVQFDKITSTLKRDKENVVITTTDIEEIKTFAFSAAPWITNLVISAPALVNIEDYAFFNLSNLESLQIRNCYHLTALKENTLKGLYKLTILNINRSNISSIDDKVFWDLPHLRILRLDSNSLATLHENTFSNLYQLRFLTISQNNLSFISNKLLKSNYNLETLGFDDNNIDRIDNNSFANLTKLISLNLKNNRLISLDNLLFNSSMLISVDISGNKIRNLSKTTFSKLHKLSYLYLSHNQVREIRHFVFTDLYNLRYLTLSNNQISYMDGFAFQNLTSLWYIYLENNEINEITEKHFLQTINIRSLYLQNNSISNISKNAFITLRNIRVLDLSSNYLTTLDEELFENSIKLYRINLSNNKIRELPLKVFQNLTKINTINLSQNNITDISKISFENLPLLKELDLSKNNIKHISEKFWRSLSKIRLLLLNDNQLKCIKKNHLRYLKCIKILNLRHNIIPCNCYLRDAFQVLPNSAQLHADCLDRDKQRMNVYEFVSNDLPSKWFRRKPIYESKPGLVTFESQSLTNQYLVRFRFIIQPQLGDTKHEIQPKSVIFTINYNGKKSQRFENDFSLGSSLHEVEVRQDQIKNHSTLTIFIDGCTFHTDQINVRKQLLSIKLNVTDIYSNYSIGLFQNVSIYTEGCSDGETCMEYLCEARQDKITSFFSPFLYPVDISRAIRIPPTYEDLHLIKLSRNITLCREISTNQIYVSPGGFISVRKEPMIGSDDDVIIAPFLSNITNCFSGNIYVEESWDLDARKIVQRDTNTTSLPDYLLLVTWINLTNKKNKTTKNSFQLVIASSSKVVIVMFKYADLQDQADHIGFFGCNQSAREESVKYKRKLSSSTVRHKVFFNELELVDGRPCDNEGGCKDLDFMSSPWAQLLFLITVLFGVTVLVSLIIFCGRKISISIRS